MRNTGFKEVSSTIQFVHHTEVLPPFRRFNQREIGVQVTIGLLARCDLCDDCVQLRFPFWIRMRPKRIRCRFYPFVDIGIVEEDTFKIPGHQASGFRKVINPAGCLALREFMRDRRLRIRFLPRCPKPVVNRDSRKRKCSQYFILYQSSHQAPML